MAALASSGQISLDDIIKHRTGAASTDVSLKLESERFASGSVVDGDAAQTTARKNLDTAPYAISELYDADFPNSQFDTVVAKFGTATETEGYVDGETARIYVDVNQQINNTIRGGLKIRTTDAIAVVADVGTNLAINTHYVNVTVPAADATTERYYAFADVAASFKKSDSSVYLDHYDALGTVAITAVGTTTVANTSTDTSITHARSIVDDSSVNDYNWSFVKTAGDGSGVSDGEGSYGTVTSTTSTPTIVYRGPATFTADLRVDGDPSQARNSSTAAQITHRIDYTKAISINNPSSLNEAATITATVSHQGFSSGIDVDLIQASDNSVLLSNDHGTDSRIVAVSNQDQTFTAPAQTAATLSVKVKGFDGSTSATSNAFNIYPLVSQELASGDISVSVDPVIVGANTVLSVANITDNIVGYRWAMTTGAGVMTSGNATGGDIDGTANDSVTIIDETSAATNTVSFNSAQSSKTITLTLYGRINQTATATKTLSVELLDATTISAISSVNATTAVTVAGNQSGLSGGVTFGLVDTGATTTFLSGKSTSDTTDSRYTLDAYTANFTAADSNSTLTLQGRVIDRSDATSGQNRNTSTFTVYPLLTTSKNTISTTAETIYSPTRNTDTGNYPLSFTFGTVGTRTDNITTRTYTEGSSNFALTGDSTPSSQTGTQPGVSTSGLGGVTSGENVTYTVTSTVADGKSASDQSTATTCAVTVNYSKEIHNIGTVSVGGDYDTVNDGMTFSFSWQGFELGSTRYELMDASDGTTQRGSDVNSTGVTGGNVRSNEGSGTVSLTSQATAADNGFNHGDGGSYKIKISLYSDGGQSTLVASGLTAAFTSYSVVEYTSTIKGVGLLGAFFGYVSFLLAAENNSSSNGTHNRLYSDEVGGGKLYGLSPLNEGGKVATDSDLGTAFNPLAAGVSNASYMHYAGFVLNIGTDGVIDDKVDATPATPASITVTSGSVSDTTWDIAVAGETYVSRLVRIYYGTSQGSTSNATSVNTSEQDASETLTTSALDVSSFAGGNVYFSARFENEAENGSTFAPDIAHAVAAVDRTLATNDSASALDTWNNQTNTYKYGDAFVLTLSNTVLNDQLIVTITHSGDALSDITTKMAMNKDNANPPYNSNGATPDGTVVQETGHISSGTPRTLTFSSLSSGTNYFTGMIEGLSDGIVNAGGIETATFTVTAVVKDSGGSTVEASATYHTYQQRINPFT